MIDAAHLPAVRERADGMAQPENETDVIDSSAAAAAAPGYPTKKLVVESGRYVVAETTK